MMGCVLVYLEAGRPVAPLEASLIKTVCWDDWSEMHMWKAVGGLCDDYASTDPANRDLHMLGLLTRGVLGVPRETPWPNSKL